jgi:hypothetical protein
MKALSTKRTNKYLEGFKGNFRERFGSREVPLPLAIDSEFGVGLTGPQGQQMYDPAPLVEGMDFPLPSSGGGMQKPHPWLMSRISSFEKRNGTYIDITRDDIRSLGIHKGSWPGQLFAIFRLAGSSEEPKIFIDLASSGNPSRLSARFGYLPDDNIIRHLRQLSADEMEIHHEIILADIVHLPEDRAGNILQRPSLYNHEIPYLALPGKGSTVIRPDQILVSVRNGQVSLRDKKSGKRVIPRLSNAHNFRNNQLPLYQFLAECAGESAADAYLPAWGWIERSYEFIPGIRYKNIVLSTPRWRLFLDDELKKLPLRGEKQYQRILSWAKENLLPTRSVWIQGDNELPVDWSNFSSVSAVWDSIRSNSIAVFREFPYDEGSPVYSESGCYANEIVLSFKKKI